MFLSFWIDDCAVIDEIQMMNDNERGWAWTRALLGLLCIFFSYFLLYSLITFDLLNKYFLTLQCFIFIIKCSSIVEPYLSSFSFGNDLFSMECDTE